MAAQAAQVAGHHPGQRRPAAARGALHLQAMGVHREDCCGPGRPPRCLQGVTTFCIPRSHLSKSCCCVTLCIRDCVLQCEGDPHIWPELGT